MKKPTSWDIVNHGVENSQYFQGCGLAHTQFKDVATGIGSSAAEAFGDALESLAQNGWDVSGIDGNFSDIETVPDGAEDCYHYVSVRVA